MHFTGYEPVLKEQARHLRKNMTPQESHLWYVFLRCYPEKIYRQRVIDRYIVDFYCSPAKLVIEIDGAQHYMQDGIIYDAIRTETLNKYQLEVIRFSNLEVDRSFEAVCQAIHNKIQERKVIVSSFP